jgi:hypothetical protein
MANFQHFNRRPSKVQAGYLKILLPSNSECPRDYEGPATLATVLRAHSQYYGTYILLVNE